MKVRPKTVRDIPSRPARSAIPRTEGSLFLMLNRLSTERARLQQDDADLRIRLEQKHQQMVRLAAEMDYYKSQIELFQTAVAPTQPSATRNRSMAVNPVSNSFFALNANTNDNTVEGEEPSQWQSLIVEY